MGEDRGKEEWWGASAGDRSIECWLGEGGEVGRLGFSFIYILRDRN